MKWRVYCVALCVILFLCEFLSANNHNRLAYLHHFRRVEQFQSEAACNVPKETIVTQTEIFFHKKLLSHEKMSPSVTVLHRCESCSGCFNQLDHSCAAKTQVEVELMFYITSIRHSHTEYRIGRAANHTSCWCQPNKPQPK